MPLVTSRKQLPKRPKNSVFPKDIKPATREAFISSPPTKYTKENRLKINQYISKVSRYRRRLPTISGLANYLDVREITLHEWAKKYPIVSSTLDKIRTLQKEKLLSDGFYKGKKVNANMAIFLLKANHKLSEGETTSTKIMIINKDGNFIAKG